MQQLKVRPRNGSHAAPALFAFGYSGVDHQVLGQIANVTAFQFVQQRPDRGTLGEFVASLSRAIATVLTTQGILVEDIAPSSATIIPPSAINRAT